MPSLLGSRGAWSRIVILLFMHFSGSGGGVFGKARIRATVHRFANWACWLLPALDPCPTGQISDSFFFYLQDLIALLENASPFVAFKTLTILDRFVRLPRDPSSDFHNEAGLADKRVCLALLRNSEFMGRLLAFLLLHAASPPITDMQWVASQGQEFLGLLGEAEMKEVALRVVPSPK